MPRILIADDNEICTCHTCKREVPAQEMAYRRHWSDKHVFRTRNCVVCTRLGVRARQETMRLRREGKELNDMLVSHRAGRASAA